MEEGMVLARGDGGGRKGWGVRQLDRDGHARSCSGGEHEA